MTDKAAKAVTVEYALRQIIEADDKHELTQQLIEIGRAALKAQPAPTEAQGEPVLWFEAEASAKGHPLRDVLRNRMLYSTRTHTTKPDVLNNALWPLYEHPAPVAVQGEDSARLEWKRITGPGQVKVGDKLRFTIGDVLFNERVKQIINPGYPDEELIYNKRRNFYVITSNAITNFGSSKNVEFLARASAETGGVKS